MYVCAQEERDRVEAANAAAEQALSLRRHAEEALESGRRELEHTQVGQGGRGGGGGRSSTRPLVRDASLSCEYHMVLPI